MIDQLPIFVYGTLLPGEPRYHLLVNVITDTQPAVLPGAELYDCGTYPAAVPGTGRVRGVAIWLRANAYDDTIALLDRVEGVDVGLFRRERRTVLLAGGCGPAAVAWVYLGDPKIAHEYPRIQRGDWRTQRDA